MILLIDVGNTNVTIGVCEGDKIKSSWRMTTNKDLTSDEIGVTLRNYFMYDGIDIAKITGTIISSVVPPIMYSLTHAVRKYIGNEPIIVNSSSKMGLTVKYDNPKEVGADRLVNAVAAIKKYQTPLIIVDFGTATTFCAINDRCEYLGGVILPGVKISLNALVEKTAKLPRIEIAKPEKVIGSNTVESMQSGMYYGYAGSVDNIVSKMKSELGENTTVIATGGLARMIAKESKTIDTIDSGLTLEGLKIIYDNETEGKE
ncbi:MAG: type III pantothenate kinase [Clostridia bacterium]|nr:type III pantothenate kinase [Clostridia bacterium]